MRGEEFHAGGGGVDAQLQRIEVEPGIPGYDKFTVEDTLRRKLFAQWSEDLGEVTVQRFFITALNENFFSIAKDEDPKAVPLRFVDPVADSRDLVDPLGEHGKQWRVDDKVHAELVRFQELHVVDAPCAKLCCIRTKALR